MLLRFRGEEVAKQVRQTTRLARGRGQTCLPFSHRWPLRCTDGCPPRVLPSWFGKHLLSMRNRQSVSRAPGRGDEGVVFPPSGG